MLWPNAQGAGTRDQRPGGDTGDTDCQMRRLDTVAEIEPLPTPSPAARPHDPPHPATVAVLVQVCAAAGVRAVVPVVDVCPGLLEPLADACCHAGLVEAAQYLRYLANPMD